MSAAPGTLSGETSSSKEYGIPGGRCAGRGLGEGWVWVGRRRFAARETCRGQERDEAQEGERAHATGAMLPGAGLGARSGRGRAPGGTEGGSRSDGRTAPKRFYVPAAGRFTAECDRRMTIMPTTPAARPVSASHVTLTQLMEVTDANVAGNVHGGVIMRLADTAAALAAIRHAGGLCVTVSVDELSFLEPVHVGDVVTLRASVNDVGTTSVECGVRVETENPITGAGAHAATAYFVFVALDEAGRPRPVPRLELSSDTERRRQEAAKLRARVATSAQGSGAGRARRGAPSLRLTPREAAVGGWREHRTKGAR